MAKCEYRVEGKVNKTHDEIFNYVADTAPDARSSEKIYKILREANIAESSTNQAGHFQTHIAMGNDSSVNMRKAENINVGAKKFFGLNQNENLLEYTDLGKRYIKYKGPNTLYSLVINENVLRKMKSVDRVKIANNQQTADEIAALLSGPTSPFKDDYLVSEIARKKNASERSKFSRLAEARVDNATRQIKKMKEAFANAGIDVEVIFDGDLQEKGMLLGVTPQNPIPRILLNPNKISEDTVYHEFAHIYVDLLGYNHPLIQQAVMQLRDTALYQEVEDYYPELANDQERLDKEVLATAIGIQGAEIDRKNPNKLQQIFNRIFRAIGRLLGVSPNVAAELAKQMTTKEINADQFLGALAPYVQKSKAERNVEKILGLLREKTEVAIKKLESQHAPNEIAINELKLQQKKLNSITEVEGFIDFVDYSTRLAARAEKTFENINKRYTPDPSLVTGDERLDMMQQLHQVSLYLQAFHNSTGKEKSTLTMIQLELDKKRTNLEKRGGDLTEITAIETRLDRAIKVMNRLEDDYLEIGIPIQADLMLEYNTPEINNKIDETIKLVKDTGREIGLNKKSKEYRLLKKQLKDKDITAEEFKAAKIKLNVEQLQSRKIGRATLINELREPQKNKSWLSYMMDPFVYSSQVSLQLFAQQVKNALVRTNEQFRETQYSLRDIYREFAETRGAGLNEAEFNEQILDTYEYEIQDWKNTSETGEPTNRKIKVVGFVQPDDVGAYYKAEIEELRAIAKKYGRPEDAEERKTWNRSRKAQEYFNAVSTWYAENSKKVDNADKILSEMVSKRIQSEKDLEIALTEGDGDKAGMLEAEIASLKIQIASSYDFKRKQYKGSLARPNSKYESKKYKELTKDKSSVEYRYYKALLDQYKKDQSQLGQTNLIKNNWDNFSYALPSIRKSSLNKTVEGVSNREGKSVVSAGSDMIRESFEIMETDTEYGVLVGLNGERLQTVPIFFTNPVDAVDVSNDVIGSILKFNNMANLFTEKSKILGSVEMMRSIIADRGTLEEDEYGNPAFNKITAKFKNMARKVVKQDSKRDPDNNLRQLSEFIDMVFYGEKELKNSLIKSINILGKDFSVSGNKLSQTATFLTAATALAGNKLQAVNQVVIDNLRLIEESAAGEFISKRGLAKAGAEYAKNLANMKTAKDLGSFAPDSKMMQAADIFDAFNDFTDTAGEKVSGNRLKKMMGVDSMFVFQNLAEHQTALTRMLAVLYGYEGKLKDKDGNVLQNEDGKPANLYDMLIKDSKGMYKMDPRVANVTQLEVINRLSSLQKKTNQLKGTFDKSLAERRAVGKVVTLFRRFLAPGFRRSWGHGGLTNIGYLHVDVEAGTISEAAYWTSYKFVRDQAKSVFNGEFSNVYNLLSTEEKANVKRTAVQALAYATSYILYGLLKGAAADDDDPEASKQYIFWAYQARRLQTEIGAFANPGEVINITSSPSAAARPMQNIFDLVTHMAFKSLPYSLGVNIDEKDIYYQRRSGRNNKGDSKAWAKFGKVLPIWSGINKDAEQAIKWFDLNG